MRPNPELCHLQEDWQGINLQQGIKDDVDLPYHSTIYITVQE